MLKIYTIPCPFKFFKMLKVNSFMRSLRVECFKDFIDKIISKALSHLKIIV